MRFCCLLLMACAGAAGVDMGRFFASGKIRTLLVSGRNNHEWRSTTPSLRKILEETGKFDVRVSEEPAGLTGEALAPYQVLVLDYNGPRWGSVAEQAVEEFVRSGHGLVAVHAASYAFGEMEILGDGHARTGLFEPPWPAYARMVGAAWSAQEPRSGHAPRHVLRVAWVDRSHPITGGMPEAFATSDELYHNLRMQDGAHVLATAYDDPRLGGTGKDEPVLWTLAYGRGRVFQTVLGHDVAAMTAPGFVASLARGAQWAATGKVDLPAAVDKPHKEAVRVMLVTGGHDHETSFYSVFEGQNHLRVAVNPHPGAFQNDFRDACDVLVLYDLVEDLPETQKLNLRAFVESGKGLVLIHHAIADFNSWTWWWREVVGGRYLLKPDGDQAASTYQHGVDLEAAPALDHPILHGVSPMLIRDETYKHMWISPDVQVLLRTQHPTSDGPLAWISPYTKSRVVYIQLGHGREAHVHPDYRLLVRNALVWAAGVTGGPQEPR